MCHVMDCKDTSIKRRTNKSAAFSLAEFLVAMAISSIVLVALSAFFLYSGKAFAGMANYVALEKNSQNALDTLTRDIRQVSSLSAFATNKLTFVDGDGGTLIFIYDPTGRTLTRTKSGTNSVLL